jgi:hypothetical protein
MSQVREWLWTDMVFEEYDEIRDDIYRCGLESDLSLALSGTTADEVLRPLRNLRRWLEILSVRSTTQVIRDLIRTEAPETLYVDEHDRTKYFKRTRLSENMRRFLEVLDTRTKTSAVGKLREAMAS